jgi:hypothetical protein
VWKSIIKETKNTNDKIIKSNVFNYIEFNILKQNGIKLMDIIKKINNFVDNTNHIELKYIKVFKEKP